MKSGKITVERGFSDDERYALAEIFWSGLGEKMNRPIGPPERGIPVISGSLMEDFVFVARLDGRPVGLAGVKRPDGAFSQLRRDDLQRHFGAFGGGWRAALAHLDAPRSKNGTMVLDALCVLPGLRGLGAGAALMRACAADAAERGLPLMTIQVLEENVAGRRFYRREGCQEISTRSLGIAGFLFGIRNVVNYELRVTGSGGSPSR